MERETFTGENIGLISISRPSSIGTKLVGSKVPNDTFISLSISEGEVVRGDFSSERFHGKKEIIQVNLTPMQYAEMISSIGQGGGVPCTISRRDGKSVPQEYSSLDPQTYYTNKVKQELKELMNTFDTSFAEAKDLLDNKKSLSKADRATIEHSYQNLLRKMTDSLPFLHTLFQEEMETVVMEASQQFKSNVTSSIEELGKEKTHELLTKTGSNLKIN